MTTRLILFAEEDMVLTNGIVYGKEFYLADGESAEYYYEITNEEYEEILKQEEERYSGEV